jgi:hypothetical protein
MHDQPAQQQRQHVKCMQRSPLHCQPLPTHVPQLRDKDSQKLATQCRMLLAEMYNHSAAITSQCSFFPLPSFQLACYLLSRYLPLGRPGWRPPSQSFGSTWHEHTPRRPPGPSHDTAVCEVDGTPSTSTKGSGIPQTESSIPQLCS